MPLIAHREAAAESLAAIRAAPLTLEGIAVTVPEPGGGVIRILDIPALQIAPGEAVGIAGHPVPARPRCFMSSPACCCPRQVWCDGEAIS
jgi:hypothetical protein